MIILIIYAFMKLNALSILSILLIVSSLTNHNPINDSQNEDSKIYKRNIDSTNKNDKYENDFLT